MTMHARGRVRVPSVGPEALRVAAALAIFVAVALSAPSGARAESGRFNLNFGLGGAALVGEAGRALALALSARSIVLARDQETFFF